MAETKPTGIEAFFAPGKWEWWAGDDELKTIGPCSTKEQAIAEATSDGIGEFQDETGTWMLGFEVIEGRQDILKLSTWAHLDSLVERANDAAMDDFPDEFQDDDIFTVTPEQNADLVERLTRAIDDWQAIHRLRFKARRFSAVRNAEDIAVEHPEAPEE